MMGTLSCIYHANCMDGFGAATILKHNYPNCKMIKGFHGESPPEIEDGILYIVDFSYPRDVIIELAKTITNIIIIDHHKSAQKDLVDLPYNVKVLFDMEKSGAGMTWDYFHSSEMPLFVQHIQDRDLWKFELPGTKNFTAGLSSLEYDFKTWDTMIYIDGVASALTLINAGHDIRRKQTKDINDLIKSSAFTMEIDGHTVPVLNVPYMYASEAGSLMAVGQPFAATYYDTEKTRNFSLRSNDEGLDVSEIATKLGGGGHRNAAGFKVKR